MPRALHVAGSARDAAIGPRALLRAVTRSALFCALTAGAYAVWAAGDAACRCAARSEARRAWRYAIFRT